MMHFSGNYLHHPTFPLSHAGVEIDAPALRNHRIFLQKVGRLWQQSYSFLGFHGDKTSKLDFHTNQGFYQELCFSKHNWSFQKIYEVLEYEYECCTEQEIFYG